MQYIRPNIAGKEKLISDRQVQLQGKDERRWRKKMLSKGGALPAHDYFLYSLSTIFATKNQNQDLKENRPCWKKEAEVKCQVESAPDFPALGGVHQTQPSLGIPKPSLKFRLEL